jgi:hypothetical protein
MYINTKKNKTHTYHGETNKSLISLRSKYMIILKKLRKIQFKMIIFYNERKPNETRYVYNRSRAVFIFSKTMTSHRRIILTDVENTIIIIIKHIYIRWPVYIKVVFLLKHKWKYTDR